MGRTRLRRDRRGRKIWRCIAYLPDGTICGRVARHLCRIRGGMVCTSHVRLGGWELVQAAHRLQEAARDTRPQDLGGLVKGPMDRRS